MKSSSSKITVSFRIDPREKEYICGLGDRGSFSDGVSKILKIAKESGDEQIPQDQWNNLQELEKEVRELLENLNSHPSNPSISMMEKELAEIEAMKLQYLTRKGLSFRARRQKLAKELL